MLALADSSKHIVQIIQLLEERCMSFSFCLNKNELMTLSGFGLLYQGLSVKREGKLIKDSQKLVRVVVELLEQEAAPGAKEFKKIASALAPEDRSPKVESLTEDPSPRRLSAGSMAAPKSPPKSARQQLQAIASRFSFGSSRPTKQQQQQLQQQQQQQQRQQPQSTIKQENNVARRSTVPKIPSPVNNLAMYARNNSCVSVSSARSEPVMPYHDTTPRSYHMSLPTDTPNLDYLPLGNEPVSSYPQSYNNKPTSNSSPASDWERLLSNIDHGQTNIYDGIYGGGPAPDFYHNNYESIPASATAGHLGGESWSTDMWNPHPAELHHHQRGAVPQSVVSFSEESLTSGEDLSACSAHSDHGYDMFRGLSMTHVRDEFALDGLDGNFGL